MLYVHESLRVVSYKSDLDLTETQIPTLGLYGLESVIWLLCALLPTTLSTKYAFAVILSAGIIVLLFLMSRVYLPLSTRVSGENTSEVVPKDSL